MPVTFSPGEEKILNMAMVPIRVGMLGSIFGLWEKGWGSDYNALWTASSGNWCQGGSFGGTHVYGSGVYLIKRGMADFDLSAVPPSKTIVSAALKAPVAVWELTTGVASGVMVDATEVTAGDSGYGEIFSKVTSLGSILIPVTGSAWYTGPREIIFNSAGLTFLQSKVGGTARIGIRIDEEIAGNPPYNGVVQRFSINPYDGQPGVGVPYILLNYL